MPNEDNKILQYNYGEKPLKVPVIIYAEKVSWKKMHSCQNNLEKSYTEKKTITIYYYSLFTNCSYDAIKNKLDCYRRKNCMERFCKDWRENSIKIIEYEKKKCYH